MTKSVGQDHASPSSSFAGYLFQGPAQVAIRTRTNDQPRYVDTRLEVWTWYDGGLAMKIDWTALQLNSELIEIGKGFMAYALEKYAPRTAVMFADTLRFLSSTNLATGLPWDTHHDELTCGERLAQIIYPYRIQIRPHHPLQLHHRNPGNHDTDQRVLQALTERSRGWIGSCAARP